MANRPKGVADEEWNNSVKEQKFNKLISLDLLPKASMKNSTKGRE